VLKKLAQQSGGGVKDKDEKTKDGEKRRIQQRKRRRLQSEGGGSMRTVDGAEDRTVQRDGKNNKEAHGYNLRKRVELGVEDEMMKEDRRGGE
jgi:hypothetical protein